MAPTRSRKTLSKEAVLVRDLAEILDAQDLTEVELETEAMAIRISRQPAGQTVVTTAAAPMAAAPAAMPAAAPATAPEPAAEAATETDFASHPGAVKSPMVGTAYESPEPGAAAFVTVGDTVKKGQTVLIIEAMKVMNPITAPQDGTVTQILVDNGQPVEFDQVLMVIA